MEPLAEAIHAHPHITGVRIASRVHKISLFADNTVLYLTNLEKSLPHLLDLIHRYGAVSGFAINQSKTEIFPIHIQDSSKKLVELNFGLKWIKNSGVT